MPQNKLLRAVLIFLALVPALIFLPFLLGGAIAYLLYKKQPASRLRNGLILALGVITLLLGSVWTTAWLSPPPTKQIQPTTDRDKVLSSSSSGQPMTALYLVSKVIDGDTVSIDINGKQEVIRLIGIDSPETVDPRKPVQCFGKEASNKAKELLDGKKVTLEADPPQGERDKYDRLLRYVFLENGTNFNKLMITEGYAHEYTYNAPYKYQVEFKEAERLAKEGNKGLWNLNACPTVTQPTNPPVPVKPTPAAQPPQSPSTNYSCAGKTTCGQMSSCNEAYFYLNNCGVSRLDGDKDGTPCETLCK